MTLNLQVKIKRPQFTLEFVNNLLSYLVDRQTDKGKNRTSLVNVVMMIIIDQ